MPDDDGPGLISPVRLLALTDGVIAIAMTLLALDLKPDLPLDERTSRGLADYLGAHAGQYAAFAIAFALIAQYWVTHHRLMKSVVAVTGRLIGLTMVFLFAITLIPLTAYLTGNYSNALAVTIFAANIFLVSAALAAVGEVTHRAQLHHRPETRETTTRRRGRMVATLVVPALVAGLAWVIGGQAAWFYLLFYAVDLPGTVAVRRLRSA